MPALTVTGGVFFDADRALGVQGDGRTADSSASIWEATENLVTNGGFETNITGWSALGAAISRVTSERKFGSASARVVTNGAAVDEGIYEDASAAVAAGSTVTVSIWVKAPAGALLRLRHVTPRIGVGATVDFVGTGDWQRVQATAALLGAGTQASVQVLTRTSVQAITFYVDGAQDELQPLATPYVHTDGATAARTAARVQAPASLLDETQFAAAFRLLPGWSSSGEPYGGSGKAYLLDWRDDANNLVAVYYDEATNKWTLDRKAAGVGSPGLSAAVTLTRDTETTVIVAGTATALKVSVDGGAFTSVANSSIPTLAAALADLLSQAGTSGHFDGRCKWAALFTGTLTDADAAAIHALGNASGLTVGDFNRGCTMVWNADTVDYGVPEFGTWASAEQTLRVGAFGGRERVFTSPPFTPVTQEDEWILEELGPSFGVTRSS